MSMDRRPLYRLAQTTPRLGEGRLLYAQNPTPNQPNRTPNTPQAPNTPNPTDGVRNRTRQQVDGAVGTTEIFNSSDVLKGLNKELTAARQWTAEIDERLQKPDDTLRTGLTQIRSDVQHEVLNRLKNAQFFAGWDSESESPQGTLKEWNDGDVAPYELEGILRRRTSVASEALSAEDQQMWGRYLSAFHDSVGPTVLRIRQQADAEATDDPNILTGDGWLTMNVETRLAIVAALSAHPAVQGMLAAIQQATDRAKRLMSEAKDVVSRADAEVGRQREEARRKTATQVPGGASYTRVSVKQIQMGVAKVWETWMKVITSPDEEKSQYVAQKLAEALGFVKGMQDTKRIIGDSVGGARSKARKEEKEKLSGASFTMVMGPGGALDAARKRGDNSAFFGALEYAADKGWLYKFLDTNKVDADMYGIRGMAAGYFGSSDLPLYLGGLIDGNNRGWDKAKKEVVDSYKNVDSHSGLFDALRGELRSLEYGRATGLIERILDKGKEAYASGAVTVTLLKELTSNADLRKELADPIMVKNIGKIFNERIPATASLLMADQFKIQAAAAANDMSRLTSGDERQRSTLVQTISAIEDRVQSASAGMLLPEIEVQDMVAKILDGQVVKLNGQTLSIFDSAFDGYRDYFVEKVRNNTEEYKTDGYRLKDYVTKGSPFLLQPESFYNDFLLRLSPTGSQFALPTEVVTSALNTISDTDKQLQGTTAGQNYRTHMRQRLDGAVNEIFKRYGERAPAAICSSSMREKLTPFLKEETIARINAIFSARPNNRRTPSPSDAEPEYSNGA
jgi:hypothetical protein